MITEIRLCYKCDKCGKPEAVELSFMQDLYLAPLFQLPYNWSLRKMKHYCWDCSAAMDKPAKVIKRERARDPNKIDIDMTYNNEGEG